VFVGIVTDVVKHLGFVLPFKLLPMHTTRSAEGTELAPFFVDSVMWFIKESFWKNKSQKRP
jgi:hypothetical protein